MSDSTTPQDSAAMPPASAGSVSALTDSILARLAVVAIATLLATDRSMAMPPLFEPPTEWQQKEEQRLTRERWLQSQRLVVAPIMVTTIGDVEELRDEVRELRRELAELRAEMREMRKRK